MITLLIILFVISLIVSITSFVISLSLYIKFASLEKSILDNFQLIQKVNDLALGNMGAINQLFELLKYKINSIVQNLFNFISGEGDFSLTSFSKKKKKKKNEVN